MKRLLLILSLFLAGKTFGQTSFGIINSTVGNKEVSTSQISAGSLWFGSKLSYNISDDNPINDNFALTGRVLYTPYATEKLVIPIVVTASPANTEVFSEVSGYNIGLYPYYRLSKSATATLLLHGGICYKAIERDAFNLQQIRILAGLELALFRDGGGAPITISITPVLTNTNGGIGSKTFVETSIVVPVSKGLGLLIEHQTNVEEGSGIKAGIITNLNAK